MMTPESFEQVVAMPAYDFLRENPHLKKRIGFLTLGGSHSYGTSAKAPDVDIRGVALERREDIIGFSRFEQFIDTQTDTVIYAFRKYIGLACDCNPNAIEMLGNRPEQYHWVSPAGQLLLDNKQLFLSKRALNSFGRYANGQLWRLQNGCTKEEISAKQKAMQALASCQYAMFQLEEKYGMPHGFVTLSLAKQPALNGSYITLIHPGDGWKAFEKAGVPLESAKLYLGELANVIKSYDSLGRRNQRAKNKSNEKLNKHVMHLLRLYLMAFDILEKGEINTYREKDREFLLEVRAGKYMREDGTFAPELFELVSQFDKRLERDAKESTLPDKPDMKRVEELAMIVAEMAIKE